MRIWDIQHETHMRDRKRVIGRAEQIGLPDVFIPEIEAKVDTGAFTSALHYSELDLVPHKGKVCLRVVLLDDSHHAFHGKPVFFDQFEKKIIRNSFGQTEERFVVTTRVHIFNEDILTEFSLSNRSDLRYPVLLGRKFLKRRFVVDVGKTNRSDKWRARREQRGKT